jgi:hypothetical protein
VKIGDQYCSVHQTLYAKVLSIAFALMRTSADDYPSKDRWAKLVSLIQEFDQMGNGVMELPFEEWSDTTLLTPQQLRESLIRARDWFRSNSNLITAEQFKKLEVAKLYWEDTLTERLLDVCEKLIRLVEPDVGDTTQ